MTAQWILNEATGRLCLDGRPVQIELRERPGYMPFWVRIHDANGELTSSRGYDTLTQAKAVGELRAAELAEFGR